MQARKRIDGAGGNPGKAAVAASALNEVVVLESHLTPIQSATDSIESSTDLNSGNSGIALFTSNSDTEENTWLLDSRATDHMTFDASDFSHPSPPRRTSIANANGGIAPVTRAGSVTLSPTLHLSHTLHVPSLSHKLMSVGQLTEELRCVVLIFDNHKHAPFSFTAAICLIGEIN